MDSKQAARDRIAALRTELDRCQLDNDVLRRLVRDLVAAGILHDAAYADLWDRIKPWER